MRGLIEQKVGKRLGLDAEAAAAAILRIANDRMAGAIRLVSLSRGHDPRDFALLPLDAAFDGPAILEQLDCTTVVEPGDHVALDKLGNLLISLRA
jgi:N-methylhydantoinase A